jgi:phospholipid transport system transporter-binding protein
MSNKGSILVGSDGSVHISGEMTFDSTPNLYRELESRFEGKGSVTGIDLAGVNRADSSGLALLLEWQAMANRQQRKLHISNAPDNLLKLAKLCEADSLLDISGR